MDVSEVIAQVVDQWEITRGPRWKINMGHCDVFAHRVSKRLENGEARVVGDPGTQVERSALPIEDPTGPGTLPFEGADFLLHVWLFDGSLHYDAETPRGVEDWRQLPFYAEDRALGWSP